MSLHVLFPALRVNEENDIAGDDVFSFHTPKKAGSMIAKGILASEPNHHSILNIAENFPYFFNMLNFFAPTPDDSIDTI